MLNSRLTDVFGLQINQDEVDFAIPNLREDIPLYIDPFLLWISAKPDYQEQHKRLIFFFQEIARLADSNDIAAAATLLSQCEEEPALGLGYASQTKKGASIGPKLIAGILEAHKSIPQLKAGQIKHLEELQLVVPGIAEDRVSDIAAAVIKGFFISFTAERARTNGIPTNRFRLGPEFDMRAGRWVETPEADLPFNPSTSLPILLVPRDLLRHLPWINYPDYYRLRYVPHILGGERARVAKQAVLEYNARNYVEVERYVKEKELAGQQCKPDPLFQPQSLGTLKAKLQRIKELPTGRAENADREYEDLVADLLGSLLYPTLEFAASRVRTISGAHIRDIIFYNDGKTEFYRDLRERYDARQPVFELKNVGSLDPEHVNQLYRYLDGEFGRFGVLVTRNPSSQAVTRNIVDLHSSKRVSIIVLNDRDLELMIAVSESGRNANEVVKKAYLDFTRLLPK